MLCWCTLCLLLLLLLLYHICPMLQPFALQLLLLPVQLFHQTQC
jgi:hypothetical protein